MARLKKNSPSLLFAVLAFLASSAGQLRAQSSSCINLFDTTMSSSEGDFWGFGSPSISGNNVVVYSTTSSGFAIFTDTVGVTGGTVLADQNSTVSGHGLLTGSTTQISISGNNVVFFGSYSGGFGIYSGTIGQTTLSTITDTSLLSPEGGTWQFFGSVPAVSGNTVVFRGTNEKNNAPIMGIYSGTVGTTGAAIIANSASASPAGGTFNSYFSNASISGDSVAFAAANGVGPAIITGNVKGSLALLAGPGTLPGQNTATFAYFDNAPSLKGNTVGFMSGFDGGSGVYAGTLGNSGVIKIADTTDTVSGQGVFTSFGDLVSVDHGEVAFYGRTDHGAGIYLGSGSGLTRVIGTGDSLFGSTVIAESIGSQSFDNGLITFSYILQNGVKGIAVEDVRFHWDGVGPGNNGAIDGGSGNWNATASTWTNAGGTINSPWQGGIAVFSGPAGTVTLTSALSAQELIFNSSGYTIAGTSILTLSGAAPEIDVTNGGDVATISAPLGGTAGLIVGGAGTLILTSATNSYTGGTTVNAATLQIGTAAAAGKIDIGSAVQLNQGGTLSLVNVSGNLFANSVSAGTGGGLLDTHSATAMALSGVLADNGVDRLSVSQTGTGVTTLTNPLNTYSGATTISGGTLQIGTTAAAGSIGANSAITLLNNGGLTLVNVFGNALANNIDHASAGSSTVTVNSTSTIAMSGALTNSNGALALAKSGTGTLVISNPANSYSGGTTLNSGTLIVNGNASDGSGSPLGTGTLTIKGGTLGTTLLPTIQYSGTTLNNPISLLGNFSVGTNSNQGNPGTQDIFLNGNIDLNGVTRTITGITNMGQVQFGGSIGNFGEIGGVNFNTSFTTAGSYVAFIFNGTNTNHYTGLTTVNNGAILVFEGYLSNGAILGNLDIEGNGVVDYILGSSSVAQIADTSTVIVNSSGNTTSGFHFDGLELRNANETIATLNGRGMVGLGSGILTVGSGLFAGVIEDGAFGTGGSLVKNNAGTLILSGRNTYTGATIIKSGTLQAGVAGTLPINSTVSVNAGATFDLHNFAQSAGAITDGTNGGGTINLGTASLTTGFNGANTVFSGAIQGRGGLVKVGSGILALTGTNTYTGPTNITTGTLEVDGSLASLSILNVATGGTLTGSGTINGRGTLAGNGTINFGAGGKILGTLTVTGGNWNGLGTVNGLITSSSGAFNINGSLAAPAGVAITGGTLSGAGSLTGNLSYTSRVSSSFSGAITGAGKVTMNKSASTLTLSGANTYTGGTTVAAGTLAVGDGAAAGASLGSGNVTINSNATLAVKLLNGESFTNMVTNNGHVADSAASGTHTLSSTIAGRGNFIKTGGSTVALTAANTYSGGTTISGGTVLANNATGSATGTGSVIVNNGGTLGGSGNIASAIMLNSGGLIAPSAGSPGTAGTTLHATSLMWNGGGTLQLQLGVAGDELVMTGALTKSGTGNYTLDLTAAGITQSSYTLFTFASTNFTTANFTLELPAGYAGSLVQTSTSLSVNLTPAPISSGFSQGTLTLSDSSASTDTTSVLNGTLSFESPPSSSQDTTIPSSELSPLTISPSPTPSDSSSLTFVAAPEPGPTALLALGATPLFGWRRRRARPC